MILKLSKVLIVEKVKGPFIYSNQRLIPLEEWHDTRDIQLTMHYSEFWNPLKKVYQKAELAKGCLTTFASGKIAREGLSERNRTYLPVGMSARLVSPRECCDLTKLAWQVRETVLVSALAVLNYVTENKFLLTD